MRNILFAEIVYMIIHLFEDQKFVDITIENFENVSVGLNKYDAKFPSPGGFNHLYTIDTTGATPRTAF